MYTVRKTFAEKEAIFAATNDEKALAIIVLSAYKPSTNILTHRVPAAQDPRSHCYAIHRKREKEMRTKTD